MTEKTPENDRKKTGFRSPYLKLLVPGAFWLGIVIFLAFSYGDAFWLWVTRAFDLSFILYTVAVIYGLYVFIPRFGASLGGLIMQGISQFFVKDKMATLSQKGVEARQAKAVIAAEAGAVAMVDPIKGMLAPYMAEQIRQTKEIPGAIRGLMADNAERMLLNSEVNFTNWVVNALDSKFHWGLSEKIKALGVITNAEKVQ